MVAGCSRVRSRLGGVVRVDGVFNLLKPPGMTSHDVVDYVRKLLGIKRAGHTGTLDPAAAGVLPICVGRATRVSEYLLGSDKAYRAVMVLGIATDTHDAQGRVVSESDASGVGIEELGEVLRRFRGVILQVPPMVSAARYQGERLYRLAMKGVTVERSPRPVNVISLEVADWRPGPRARVILDITCSKGTYVRTLCHDIGQALGCGAYLHFLVRTRHGPFELEGSSTLEELCSLVRSGDPHRVLIPLTDALSFMPQVVLRPEEIERVQNGGQPFPRQVWDIKGWEGKAIGARPVRLVDAAGRLVGIARVEVEGERHPLVNLRLEKVLWGSGADG